MTDEDYIKSYMEYEAEELEYMIENENEIETGCPINCDRCIENELKWIKEALKRIKKK